jgi:hypothetical protein
LPVSPCHDLTAVANFSNKKALTQGFSDGRYWARNRPELDRPELTWSDFSLLFQGLLVDAEGRSISLSPTALHSALGRIRDMVAGSDELRRIAELLVRELTEQ